MVERGGPRHLLTRGRGFARKRSLRLRATVHRMRVRRAWQTLWPGAEPMRMPFAPGHFYSPIPAPADVDAIPEVDAHATLPGIDLRVEEQVAFLRTLAVTLPTGPRFSANGYYDDGDAAIYQAIVRTTQPARVVEVGAGWSTAALFDAAATPAVTVIDPDPSRVHDLLRPDDLARCTIVARRLQDVDLAPLLALEAGDILFVDSTHVAKHGSDVNRIVLDVLPQLRPGVLVHFHDVLYPFEYPADWFRRGRHWSEAYLLRAFLACNDTYEILLWPDLLRRLGRIDDPDLLAAVTVGASAAIWIRRRGPEPGSG